MTVLTATGAGVRHRRRWLVQGLDLRVAAGETVAVTGPPGSGRTSALLALARRLRLSAGTVEIVGTAALGHVPDVEEPEPVFTVAEHIVERLTLLGRSRADDVPLHGLDPTLRGRELTPYQKQVLGLVLAGLNRPSVIALDGVDAGLDAAEREALWALLGEIAASGVAVLVTAREVDPALVDQVVVLDDPQAGEPGRATVVRTAEPVDAEVPA
ncbi:ABC transporter ATP-binding protein [Actinoplanes sp. NPDC023936]|uniref:ABC transporter ATP-binding protein n=1 Tax=Actinoplanes sp. NPDC023936 TaxID=3154910 RepID=UPI0033F217EE